jgi:hypothetical protein
MVYCIVGFRTDENRDEYVYIEKPVIENASVGKKAKREPDKKSNGKKGKRVPELPVDDDDDADLDDDDDDPGGGKCPYPYIVLYLTFHSCVMEL